MKKIFQSAAITASILIIQFIAEGQGLFIEQINVSSKYNASYLLTYSNVLLFKITDLDKKRVQKVMDEFKESGLYDDIKWDIVRRDPDGRSVLNIRPIYKREFESTLLDDVVLDDYPTVDKEQFLKHLNDEGVTLGSPWFRFSFSDVVTKIRRALDKSSRSAGFNSGYDLPWVSIRTRGRNKVTLIVHEPSYDPISLFDAP